MEIEIHTRTNNNKDVASDTMQRELLASTKKKVYNAQQPHPLSRTPHQQNQKTTKLQRNRCEIFGKLRKKHSHTIQATKKNSLQFIYQSESSLLTSLRE